MILQNCSQNFDSCIAVHVCCFENLKHIALIKSSFENFTFEIADASL